MTHADGDLPQLQAADGPWSIYLHVPFCASRCGYCDFNTYVLSAMGEDAISGYLEAAHRELDLAGQMWRWRPAVSTIFFGGGTPTMLTPAQLGELVDHIRTVWGIDDDAEITTEANPETLDEDVLSGLLAAGINRLSMGMQSSDEFVLTILDRRHRPGRAVEMARLARQVGFDDVSLDLIFGAPGEDLGSWRCSLEAALSAEPDHVSAYSLIVEEGTRLAARIRRGELPMTDEDDLADKYLIAERVLTEAGYVNYEVSNWARPRDGHDHRCRHNMAYWLGRDWWGIGPGAHSHVNGTRWWNVKHPATYRSRLAEGRLPVEDHEVLDAEQRHEETVLLQLRLADGLPLSQLTEVERHRADHVVEQGLGAIQGGHLVLNLSGRMVADRIITDLLV
ncbi:radical SAM family heme chaperone HemW [Cutibacterium avidum]|uniref:radical SAM family heme chaperone HemW n=1 Tax=Cutibacterium avidum TaxID=33010 RepID=UPI002572D8E2|nr:radical SAM family heme chaperone HemW [Cutibacterium avidum]BDY02077.1 putative oxygen-independent coproporphyrinogen III oxidase HemN [Cutibacterium avidum]